MWVLGVTATATVLAYAAWARRAPGVKWWRGPGGTALFRPELFTAEGNRLRRRALRWYGVAAVSFVVGLPLLFIFEESRGDATCWDSSPRRPA